MDQAEFDSEWARLSNSINAAFDLQARMILEAKTPQESENIKREIKEKTLATLEQPGLDLYRHEMRKRGVEL